ncbi:MAG: GAF domain-containing protein [Gemmatimonadaceae bacterium]
MTPRTLASLAHALGAAATLDGALLALGDSLLDLDRGAALALIRYDARKNMLRERLTPVGAKVARGALETTFDHLPPTLQEAVRAGTELVDVTDKSADYARLFGFGAGVEGGMLALRGFRVDGSLASVLAVYEPRKIFGTRASERLAPSVALFELAYARLAEQEAREEAVRTLEDVTRRVHGDYVRKLGALEKALDEARSGGGGGGGMHHTATVVALQTAAAKAMEEARQAELRADVALRERAVSTAQLEQAHQELHRRQDLLRRQTRTLFLVDRLLTLDAASMDPRALVDGLLALVGDDMQAQRCSLMLVTPEPGHLYLAAARGITRNLVTGMRVRIGDGVAGRVAAARTPLLVRDVQHAAEHPLLHDQIFTTGSFICFPLVYHGELVGVVNLSNPAAHGGFTDDDVERVRLLGMIMALLASTHRLSERLLEVPDAV